MTDIETLDDAEGKDLNNYQKQRLKYKEQLDAMQAQLDQERAGRVADKVAYFKSTLTSQGFTGDFDEFANKYANNLGLDEMVALYKGINGAWQQVAQTTPSQEQPQQPVIWPQSVIGQNPIGGDQAKDFSQLSLEEMKARGRANPQIFND